MPKCDEDGFVTIPHMIFMYLTYIAIGLVLYGWCILLYSALKLHRVARTGELLRADCHRGYLELETGQASVLEAYIKSNFQKKLKDAIFFVKLGILFLAASVVFSLSWSMFRVRVIKAKPDSGEDEGEGDDAEKLSWPMRALAVAWLLLGYYVLVTTITTVTGGANESMTMGFIITAIILLAVLYLVVSKVFEQSFFVLEELVVARGLWMIILVFAGGLWLASTLYTEKIDTHIELYLKKLAELHNALKLVKRSPLLHHLTKNYAETPQNAGQSDDPPTLNSIKDLLNEKDGGKGVQISDAVFYVKHDAGEELRDVVERIRDEPHKYGDISAAIENVKVVRLKMSELRNMNNEFNHSLSVNTGILMTASSLVILIPAFLLYNRIAPALFGRY